ncbi:hypothetical protein JI739_09850 [Ramlibacter sp. AW1]|uniref:DUF3224 domain-containing protein n=1 Tax=Ramlibacter aurantiacus TaxID=2801330 RepID=A0A936ZMY8_9BURK|nr:hypothetical protein [Ramlibacter aurantiacus]MBL0420646.1 hypothetical protein [Ramlibacter aurantiacus]
MKLLPTSALCRAALMVVCTASASAAFAGPDRPFKGSLQVEERIGRLGRCPGPQGQPSLGGTFTGTGHATHLGAVQISGSHCITSEPGTPPPAFSLAEGHMTMHSASGDEVLADYAGVFTLVTTGTYTFAGQYVITGGTGRFSDATGGGALTGTLTGDVPSFQQSVSLDALGDIRY